MIFLPVLGGDVFCKEVRLAGFRVKCAGGARGPVYLIIGSIQNFGGIAVQNAPRCIVGSQLLQRAGGGIKQPVHDPLEGGTGELFTVIRWGFLFKLDQNKF